MHVDEFQPSLLRLLKKKGFALATASSSGRCHESDQPQTPMHFTLFVNDKINNCDREDVKRQIELQNVLAGYSSLTQMMKRTVPKLKCVEFDGVDLDKSTSDAHFTIIKTLLEAFKRFCDCDFVSLS